jgi:hypothetical protein
VDLPVPVLSLLLRVGSWLSPHGAQGKHMIVSYLGALHETMPEQDRSLSLRASPGLPYIHKDPEPLDQPPSGGGPRFGIRPLYTLYSHSLMQDAAFIAFSSRRCPRTTSPMIDSAQPL